MSLKALMRQHSHSFVQLFQFGIVGGLGVIVNQTILVAANVASRDLFQVSRDSILLPLPFTDFNIRNYHLYVMVAFLVANLFNFILNRYWTFAGKDKAVIWREYLPFLLVGLGAQLVGLLLITALLNPVSPICLPDSIFDDSSGLRNKLYWANLIVIGAVTPINFVLNKLWTFRAVRRKHGQASA